MITRIPCKTCGASILPDTADRTGGICMPCFQDPSGERFIVSPPPLPVAALLARLDALLPEVLCSAAQKAIEELNDERVYGFALFHGHFSYACATVFTEVALDTRVHEYRTRGYPTTCEQLRWNPCDSPRHEFGSEFFSETEEVFSELDRHQDLDHSPSVERVFLHALEVLRKSGILPSGLLITLMEGDQSKESRFAYAELFNEPATLSRFREELEPLDEVQLNQSRDLLPTEDNQDV